MIILKNKLQVLKIFTLIFLTSGCNLGSDPNTSKNDLEELRMSGLKKRFTSEMNAWCEIIQRRVSALKTITDDQTAKEAFDTLEKIAREEQAINIRRRKVTKEMAALSENQSEMSRWILPLFDKIQEIKREEEKEKHRLRNITAFTNFEKALREQLRFESVKLPTGEDGAIAESDLNIDPAEKLQTIHSLLDSRNNDSKTLAKTKALLDQMIAADADNSRVWVAFARWQIMSGYRYGNYYDREAILLATKAINRALKLDPQNAEAWLYHCSIDIINHDPLSAREHLAKAESLGTDHPGLVLNMANILHEEGKMGEQQQLLEEFLIRGKMNKMDRLMALQDLLFIYADQNDYEKATRTFAKIIEIEDNNGFIWGNYGNKLLFSLGRLDEAIAKLEKALSFKRYGIAQGTVAMAYYAKWAQLLNNGEAPKAQTYFRKAQRFSPDLDDIMASAGRIKSLAIAGPLIENLSNQKNVSLLAQDKRGRSLIGISVEENNLAVVKFLLNKKIPLVQVQGEIEPPLSIAARKGYQEMVTLLLNAGADINEQASTTGATALYEAAGSGHKAIVKALLDGGADINRQTKRKSTPLMAAVMVGRAETIELLLKAGARMEGLVEDTYTWEEVAAQHGPEVMALVDEHRVKP